MQCVYVLWISHKPVDNYLLHNNNPTLDRVINIMLFARAIMFIACCSVVNSIYEISYMHITIVYKGNQHNPCCNTVSLADYSKRDMALNLVNVH